MPPVPVFKVTSQTYESVPTLHWYWSNPKLHLSFAVRQTTFPPPNRNRYVCVWVNGHKTRSHRSFFSLYTLINCCSFLESQVTWVANWEEYNGCSWIQADIYPCYMYAPHICTSISLRRCYTHANCFWPTFNFLMSVRYIFLFSSPFSSLTRVPCTSTDNISSTVVKSSLKEHEHPPSQAANLQIVF